jgi:hypothetical protein
VTDLESATVAEQFKALLRIADALATAGKPARCVDVNVILTPCPVYFAWKITLEIYRAVLE